MSNYLIGIGGTGQRVTTAFIHACFMNAIRDTNDNPVTSVSVMVIDKDNNSGDAAEPKLDAYSAASDGPMAKTQLVNLKTWEPTPGGQPSSLESLASSVRSAGQRGSDASLAESTRDAKLLMGALFSKYERTTLAEKENVTVAFADGFKGHPNVGATYQDVAMQDGIMDSESRIAKMFKTIQTELDTGAEVKVCIVASLFGGTGASGLPLLVQRLRALPTAAQQKQIKIGAVMMLPFFTYKPNTGVPDRIGLLYSNRQTQAALKYYENNGYMDADNMDRVINDTYLIGLPELPEVGEYCEGGKGQLNRPVFAELTAAFSARHFFVNEQNPTPQAWVVGINQQPDNSKVIRLDYGALIGVDTEKARLQQVMQQALRYAVYSQLYAYWGLVNWTESGQDVEFLPDNGAKMWLKNAKFASILGKDSAERRAFTEQLDNMMRQNLSFLRWLIDIMWHRPKFTANHQQEAAVNQGQARAVFPGFGVDVLSPLYDRIQHLEQAYARDNHLTRAQKPLRDRSLLHGVRSSDCQNEWENWFDSHFPGEGAGAYSQKILHRLNNARGIEKLADVLNMIYEECL